MFDLNLETTPQRNGIQIRLLWVLQWHNHAQQVVFKAMCSETILETCLNESTLDLMARRY